METKDGQNQGRPRPGGHRGLHTAKRPWVGWEGGAGCGPLPSPPPPWPRAPAVSPQHAHAGSRISGWPPPAGLYLRLPASPLSPRCAFTCSLCLCVFVQVCGLWPGCSGQSAVLGQLPAEPAPPPSPFSRSRQAHVFLGTLLIPATWPRPGGPEPLGSFCLEGTAGLGVDREAKDRLGDTV